MPLVSAPAITQTAGGQNLFAVAGSSASGGVTQLLAGTNVTLSPPDGLGVVTITAAGGGGSSGVSSVTASGDGITATPTSGAVVVANTGVTSLVAGSGVSVSGASGAVTVGNSGVLAIAVGSGLSVSAPNGSVSMANTGVTSLVAGSGISLSGAAGDVTVSSTVVPTFSGYQVYQYTPGAPNIIPVTGTCGRINLGVPGELGSTLFSSAGGGTGWQLTNTLNITNPSFNAQTRLIFTDFLGAFSPAGGFASANTLDWNATGTFDTVPTQIKIRLYGGGSIPAPLIAGQQYYIEYAVLQLNA
jgi:hypothetical protein